MLHFTDYLPYQGDLHGGLEKIKGYRYYENLMICIIRIAMHGS